MEKPEKCCNPGEYTCQIPMPLNGRLQSIDFCIADIVAVLNSANIKTVASCCGHSTQDGSIILEDGRDLIVRQSNMLEHINTNDMSHEIWAVAQLLPEEGIEDGVHRIKEILSGAFEYHGHTQECTCSQKESK